MNRHTYLNGLLQIVLLLYSATTTSYSSYSPLSLFKTNAFSGHTGMKDMKVIHGWKTVDYLFPNSATRHAMIKTGHYIPGNSLILDADYWQDGDDDIIFVSLPRFKNGIPATLAKVSDHIYYDGSPKLEPYPDWSWQNENNCEGLVSVFRTKIDECGRLWVIDSGVTNILHSPERMCQPKLMAFDLFTDTLVVKYVFPSNVLESSSLLVTIAVDNRALHCGDTFVYVADVTQFGLIVFDSKTHHSWRIASNYFYPYPLHGSFNIAGTEFDLMDGVIGLALSPVDKYGDRTLYFHSLASVRESKVLTSLLRNETNFMFGENRVAKKFYTTDEVRPSQSAAQDMSENHILFFGMLTSTSIGCWNSRMPYLPFNIVTLAQNNETLQFASGVKIVKKNGQEELLVTSSKFPKYLIDKVNKHEFNFRILSASVKDLVRNTLCEFGTQDLFPESYQTIELKSWK